jgi:hypothetical protein
MPVRAPVRTKIELIEILSGNQGLPITDLSNGKLQVVDNQFVFSTKYGISTGNPNVTE